MASCATPEYAMVHGQRVARPTVAYGNGDSFAITHKRAFPGVFDPARGRDVDDGTIIGRACGVDLRFDAEWNGSRLTLSGQGELPTQHDFTHTEGAFALSFDVTELAPGRRRIHGRVGDVRALGPDNIDLDVSSERLEGRIGRRRLALAADGDFLAGRIDDAPFAIYGRQRLESMVPADEALILVMLLTCNGLELDYGGQRVRGFSLAPKE